MTLIWWVGSWIDALRCLLGRLVQHIRFKVPREVRGVQCAAPEEKGTNMQLLSDREMMDRLRQSPEMVAVAQQREHERREQAKTDRIACLDALELVVKEGEKADAEILKFQPTVDAALKEYERVRNQLGDMIRGREALRGRESALCSDLGGKFGEGVLDIELMRTPDGIAYVKAEIVNLKERIKRVYLEPGSSAWHDNEQRKAKVVAWEAQQKKMEAGYQALLKLRGARVSPDDLARMVQEVLDTFAGFNYVP